MKEFNRIEEKNFSEGFMHDIVYLLQYCAKNKTDNANLQLEINDKKLNINISFKIEH